MNFQNLYKRYHKGYMESSSSETPEFRAFAKAFMNGLKVEVKIRNLEVVQVFKGHFELSGFLRRPDKSYIYFNVGDMRWGLMGHPLDNILWRFADNERDFIGKQNRYSTLTEVMDDIVRATA